MDLKYRVFMLCNGLQLPTIVILQSFYVPLSSCVRFVVFWRPTKFQRSGAFAPNCPGRNTWMLINARGKFKYSSVAK